ncbi:hypothetical protein [Sphingomonas sp.]|uniref:hypothetical protein n=1 Tax=Sphingomonas sp. TaxID=28214 RepID=UPI0035BC0D4D
MEASAAPPAPLPPPAAPNWVAIAAFALSIITLLKTLWSDFRAWRSKAAAKFETDLGTPIRTGLRSYEKKLFTLRAFTVPSGRSLDELKDEIGSERAKWIEAAEDLARLLREADDTGELVDQGWAERFTRRTEAAEELMIRMTEPAVTTFEDLRLAALAVQIETNIAVAEVRSALKEETASYGRILGRR